MPDSLPYEITPREVKTLLDGGSRLLLIDVREPHEHAICSVEGARLIPMNSVPERLQAIEAAADESRVIVFCHHGVRSLTVVNWLRQQGVAECQSMSGGIDQWSAEIDPAVPRY
ncbi:MAG TPA: rhodanese-like domain-containing protein [Bryobacteraceae bacterium]|nr:rhodanese-like domain-containing protein [Bryobacteraceae bacterium]